MSSNPSNRPGNIDSFWGIKFKPGEIVVLTKDNGETVDVRIESVDSCFSRNAELIFVDNVADVIYRVREKQSRIVYPVMQECLKRRQQVDVKA